MRCRDSDCDGFCPARQPRFIEQPWMLPMVFYPAQDDPASVNHPVFQRTSFGCLLQYFFVPRF
jgi:hypothetical protein